MTVVEVGPGLGSSTLRAVLGLVRRRRAGTLPEVELLRRDVRVDREHLAAYDRVCGFRLNDRLPPTYPHVLAFPLIMRLLTAPGFPFPAAGLVHIAGRVDVLGDLRASSSYDLRVRAAGLRAHERGRQVDLHVTATVDGEPVWTSVSTYLHRTSPSTASTPAAASPAPAPSALWRVPARVGRDYAAVSGDRNPLHTSRLGARLFGFPRPIAHGMWSLARCLSALEGRLPDRCTVEVRFRQPILLPATVSFAYDGGRFTLSGRRPHLAGQVTPA